MLAERAGQYQSREVFRYFDKSTQGILSMSWDEMIGQTHNVSRAIKSLGYGYDDKIGIFSGNRPEWTIADFGILAVRGVAVPFYSTSSKHEIKYIVDETEMKLMFVGNHDQLEKALWVLDHCDTLDRLVVFEPGGILKDERCMAWKEFLELGSDEKYALMAEKALAEAEEDDLATIIYTSGTTGEPKGVMLGHNHFMFAFGIHDKRIPMEDTDVSMCFLPLSHVFERTWTFYVLYKGAVNHYLENPREVIEMMPKVRPTTICVVPRFFEKTHEGIMLEYSKWPGYKKKLFDWSLKIGYQISDYKSKNLKVPALLKNKYALADKLVLGKLRNIFGGNIKFMPVSGAAIRPELLRFFHATGLFVNYGYGATETTATVSCFKSDVYNFDTCGTTMPDVEVKFGEEGEIMVKGGTVFSGYYNKPEETLAALQDGYYMTGDKGYFADNGDLVMTDRIKDLMKTSLGKYISPQKLELLLGNDRYIEQMVVVGDDRKFVSALIVPSYENLHEKAKEFGLSSMTDAEVVENEVILAFMQKRIDLLQEELSQHEKIVKFHLLPEAFSIEKNTMTSTLKLRRKIIAKQYCDQIEAMYLSS